MSLKEVKASDPVTIVIFGATGDLTRRKLFPALYTLFRERTLPKHFTLIAFARRDYTTQTFSEEICGALKEHSRLPPNDAAAADFCSHLVYHRGDLSDPKAFRDLKARFGHDPDLPQNRLLYLSIAPDRVEQTVRFSHDAGLITPADQTPWTRVIVEKPFGRDLTTASELNRCLLACLSESQIYRIDHYLGKETVQNILSFRFANTIFEPVFNRSYVDHIQITAAETVGMERGRGAFYDRTGALRDMVANHLFQLLCLVTMEPPDGLTPTAIRAEKMKILHALLPAPNAASRVAGVLGQYAAGEETNAFHDEDRVAPNSQTETFAALRMEINNWRWAGVPIYLRTGKRLAKKTTEIAVQFRIPAMQLFQHVACEGDVCDLTGVKPNTLVFRIQPNEGIFLQVSAKRPSMQLVVESIDMDFSYSGKWNKDLPEAYERLLLDALRGDPTLFTRSDEVEAEWQVIDAIWNAIKNQPPTDYRPDTWGPPESEQLIAPFKWRNE